MTILNSCRVIRRTALQELNSKQARTMIGIYSPGNNYFDQIQYFSSWTINGSPVTSRNLFRFDQFDIPSNATVTNADLSLFYEANSFGVKNTSLTNSNSIFHNPTTSAWNEG